MFDLSCAKAAHIVKDYNQEQFMEVFQIEPDMNDEDYKNLVIKSKINFGKEINKNSIEKEKCMDFDIGIDGDKDLTKHP